MGLITGPTTYGLTNYIWSGCGKRVLSKTTPFCGAHPVVTFAW